MASSTADSKETKAQLKPETEEIDGSILVTYLSLFLHTFFQGSMLKLKFESLEFEVLQVLQGIPVHGMKYSRVAAFFFTITIL